MTNNNGTKVSPAGEQRGFNEGQVGVGQMFTAHKTGEGGKNVGFPGTEEVYVLVLTSECCCCRWEFREYVTFELKDAREKFLCQT